MLVWLHNIPLLQEKYAVYVQHQHKTDNYDKNICGYKTYNHMVFARFLRGFISVRKCFFTKTRILCSDNFHQLLTSNTHIQCQTPPAQCCVSSWNPILRTLYHFQLPTWLAHPWIQVSGTFEHSLFAHCTMVHIQEVNKYFRSIMAHYLDAEHPDED